MPSTHLPFFALAAMVALSAQATSCQGSEAAHSSCPEVACQQAVGHNADGSCRYAARANGLSCDDHNPCTVFETCQQGLCTAGTILADGAACDDDNVCTQGDHCQSGACLSGNTIACGAPQTCEAAFVCDPKRGCIAGSAGPCVERLASVTLSGCTFYGYTAPVVVGAQSMALLVDTGSSTTAVAGASCANCTGISPAYDNRGDTTGAQASANYHDGASWNAQIYTDVVQPQLTNAQGQAPQLKLRLASIARQSKFFSGSACSGTFIQNAYQGVWGLGPQLGARSGTDSYTQRLSQSGATLFDAFAVQLCEVGGRVWLGGYNPSAGGQGPLLQTPMQTTANGDGSHYAISVSDVRLGTQSLGVNSFGYGSVLVDTASGPLFLPKAAYDALRQMLTADPAVVSMLDLRTFDDDGSGTHAGYPALNNALPADVDAKLPWLVVQLPQGGSSDDFELALRPSKSYLTANLLANGSTTQFVYTFTAFPSDQTILGAAMLKEHVVVFDRGGAKIGFLPQAQGCSSALPFSL